MPVASRRIVFAGTPAFAIPALRALLDAGHTVAAVLTQPDRPSGRGRKLGESPVKQLAVEAGLPLFQPATLKTPEMQQKLAGLGAEVFVVVAYGLLLPQEILDIPRFGALNIHASLLPRWRGAAPIQRAIEAGDHETGISIMRMDQGLDTGNVLLKESIPIGRNQSAGEVHDHLASLGARLIVAAVDDEAILGTAGEPQDETLASHARKLSKAEARLDWQQPAAFLQRKIQAFNPWPVADTLVDQKPLRVFTAFAKPTEMQGMAAGVVIAESETGIEVATGDGCLVITQLQWPGSRPMAVAEFLNGRSLLGKCLA